MILRLIMFLIQRQEWINRPYYLRTEFFRERILEKEINPLNDLGNAYNIIQLSTAEREWGMQTLDILINYLVIEILDILRLKSNNIFKK